MADLSPQIRPGFADAVTQLHAQHMAEDQSNPPDNYDRINAMRAERGLPPAASPGQEMVDRYGGNQPRFPDVSEATPDRLPAPGPRQAELRGTGPGESRDPFKAAGYYDTLEQRLTNRGENAASAVLSAEYDHLGHVVGSVHRAYQDPSIPNLTAAGVNTAMTVPSLGAYKAALGIGATGLAAAGVKDLGGIAPSAAADTSKKQPPQAPSGIPDLPGATPAENTQYRYLMQQFNQPADSSITTLQRKGWHDDAAAIAKAVVDRESAKGGNEREAAKAARERQVRVAETARDDELKNNFDFKKTNFGKTYGEIAGPLVAGVPAAIGLGYASRAASGPTNLVVDKYVMPAAAGTGAMYLAEQFPEGVNMAVGPNYNVDKKAYEKYAALLPDGNEKAQAKAYADSLGSDKDSVQSRAMEAVLGVTGLQRLAVAAGTGGLEGVAGAKLRDWMVKPAAAWDAHSEAAVARSKVPDPRLHPGQAGSPAAQSQTRIGQASGPSDNPKPAVANVVPSGQGQRGSSSVVPAAHQGPGSPPANGPGTPPVAPGAGQATQTQGDLSNQQSTQTPGPSLGAAYPGPSDPLREMIRMKYADQIQQAGGRIPTTAFNDTIQRAVGSAGGSIKNINGRTSQTNKNVDSFVAANGRPPRTEAEWQSMFGKGTLAVPMMVGAGAATNAFREDNSVENNSSQPAHHSTFQPRSGGGQFNGAPRYPKGYPQ